jgi:hypothetical protein
MKKMLLIATAFVSMSAVVFAQETVQMPEKGNWDIQLPMPPQVKLPDPGQPSSSSAVENVYSWFPRHFHRNTDNDYSMADSNYHGMFVPTTLSFNGAPAEQRGIGEIFAPMMIYSWFKDLAKDTTNLVFEPDQNPNRYSVFQNMTDYTIDSIVVFLLKNPNATAEFGGKFVLMSTPDNVNIQTYFNSTNYKNGGFFNGRSTLPVKAEINLTADDINNLPTDDQGNPAPLLLKNFDPPLVFTNKIATILMYINDEAPAVDPTEIVTGNTLDYQVIPAFWNYRFGDPFATGTTPGINAYKSLGAFMIRQGGADSIFGLAGITYTTTDGKKVAAAKDLYVEYFGVASITSSVKYYFGREATMQGLGQVTPNPVASNARLPFSLTEMGNVNIDLFDVNGQLVQNLVAGLQYVPGNYTVDLPVDKLQSGSYLARMTVKGNVYTMKFNVSK